MADGPHVLLVEDDEPTRSAVGGNLRGHGYRVAEAFDWVRHDPIVSTRSALRAGDRVEGVVVEASPLKGVIDELALTIVAHHRVRGQLPPALRAFAHVFGPNFGG